MPYYFVSLQYQVLEYMRTDVSVGGQQVVTVVLGDVVSSLRHPIHNVRMAIEKGKYGQKQVTKDFLIPGDNGVAVTRDINSRRRKCDIIILSKIDPRYGDHLKEGNEIKLYLEVFLQVVFPRNCALQLRNRHILLPEMKMKFQERVLLTKIRKM